MVTVGDLGRSELVEGLSPPDRWSEVRKKLKEYFAIGVMAGLIVEPEELTASLQYSPPIYRISAEEDTLLLDDILPELNLSLTRLWEKVP